MTAKQVILEAARLIGIEDTVDGYFLDANAEGEKAVNALLSCLYLVETELASEHFPLKTEEEFYSHGEIAFEEFSYQPLRIVSVAATDGKKAEAVICPTGIKVAEGAYQIGYTYAPSRKGVEAALEFDAFVTAALVGYGVAAQYCLIAGLYEEAAVWGRKYKQAIAAVKPMAKGGAMRAREWN